MADRTDINRGAPVTIAPRPLNKVIDPRLTRRGGAAHRGGIVVTAAALVFFAYVFNLGGLQGWLNGSLQDLDHVARSHNRQVAAGVQAWLPYVAIGVGTIAGLFMLNLLTQLIMAGPSKKSRKKVKTTPVAQAEVVVMQAPEARPAAEPAVLVRPYRPPMPAATQKQVPGPRPVESPR